MKKTILFAIVLNLLNIFIVYSQNQIDPPKLQSYTNTAVFDRDWNKTNFVLGWNWGSSGRRLDEALGMNYYHVGFSSLKFSGKWSDTQFTLTDSSRYARTHRQLMKLPNLVGSYDANLIFNAQAISLNPVIIEFLIESIDPLSSNMIRL